MSDWTISDDANEARHLALSRFEQAAGAAFGCETEDDRPIVRVAMAPAAFAIATFASALVATIAYFL